MAKFYGTVLNVLSRIYPLTGSGQQNVDKVDLASPITLVHDVSREVETAQGFYEDIVVAVTIAADNTNTFSDVPSTSFVKAAIAGRLGKAESAVQTDEILPWRMWLCGYGVSHESAGALSWASAIVRRAGRAPGATTASGVQPIFHGSSDSSQPGTNTPAATEFMIVGIALNQSQYLPRLIFPNESVDLVARSSAGAPFDMVFSFRCWFGLEGVLPPGLG